MIRMDQPTEKKWRQTAGYALLILPAVALGVWAMSWGGISPVLWGQQIAAWVVFALLALPLRHIARRIPAVGWSILLLIPLAATLLGEDAGGIRRWVDLVVFHVNAAMLVLPAMLVVMCCVKYPHPVWLGAAIILCFQPDLSQLTALAAAVIPILWQCERKLLWRVGNMLLLGVLMIRCMSVPAEIEPVSYCEEILTMLGEMSCLLQAAGWMTIAAIPVFWMHRFWRQNKTQMLSLSIYYAVSMLFALSGEYPVPFIGFGLSPIAGYWLAFILLGALAPEW